MRMKHVLASVALSISAAAVPAAAETVTASQTEEAHMAKPMHAAWTALLQTYIETDASGLNRFDYGALTNNADDRAALDAYIAGFETLDFEAMSDDEAFAAWANLYNAVTVQHIVGRYPVRSIRAGYIVGPWKEVKVIAGGREVSLDDIEHNILRQDWDEPRVHYAVNCASYGCPNLADTALEAATLNDQLDVGARAYINHARGVTIRRNGTLEVSTIYKWFREDFGGSKQGVVEHLLEYADDDLAAQIRANPKITKHSYDWALNDVEK